LKFNLHEENKVKKKKVSITKKKKTKKKSIMESNVDISKIRTGCAISFLNDFRLALVRFPGDIGFRVKRNPNNLKLDQYATKYLHSTILLARSNWFRDVFANYLYDVENIIDIIDSKNENVKDINVIVSHVTEHDEDKKLVLQIDGVSLESFQEFSKTIFLFVLN
jgi:hypothetical protein